MANQVVSPHTKDGHLLRIAAIEAEFGEAFADIVTGMREQEYPYSTIAGALGVPTPTFRKWLYRYDLIDGRHHDAVARDKCAKPLPCIRPTDHRAQQLGFRDAGQLVIDFRIDGKTNDDIAHALGCHLGHVYYITPKSVIGLGIITPQMREARRRNMNRINACRRAG